MTRRSADQRPSADDRVLSPRLRGHRLGRRRVVRDVTTHRVLDAAGEPVDQLGVLGHRIERAGLAPACDVGDRLAADVQADARGDDDRSRFYAAGGAFRTVPAGRFCGLVGDSFLGVLPT